MVEWYGNRGCNISRVKVVISLSRCYWVVLDAGLVCVRSCVVSWCRMSSIPVYEYVGVVNI